MVPDGKAESPLLRPRLMDIQLFHAPDEKHRPDDLPTRLREMGLDTPPVLKNPVTYDWVLQTTSAFLQQHGEAIGVALVGLLTTWLKGTKGRRIEIRTRDGVSAKASSVRQLKKVLATLHEYDRLTVTLNRAETAAPRNKNSWRALRNTAIHQSKLK
jgi:hypothetical protein